MPHVPCDPFVGQPGVDQDARVDVAQLVGGVGHTGGGLGLLEFVAPGPVVQRTPASLPGHQNRLGVGGHVLGTCGQPLQRPDRFVDDEDVAPGVP